jgi:DNA-binding beta-propeller fold protein YncE
MRYALALTALLLLAAGARAEIAVSANDGKQKRPDDVVWPEPDSISVLDIRDGRIKLLGTVATPATMIGPPDAVAVAKDSSFALVTSGQKLEKGEIVPDDLLQVIDLSVPSNPRVVQTVHAGAQATGVSISPNGRLVLTANTAGDSVSVFRLRNRRLTPAGTVAVEKGSGPTDVFFLKDGKTAVVVGRQNFKLMLLSVDGDTVRDTGKVIISGRAPYGGVATHDGKYMLITNLQGPPLPPSPPAAAGRGRGGRGGRGGGSGSTIAMINVATGQVVAQTPVGNTSEHVTLSPDGKYAAVTILGSASGVTRLSPDFETNRCTLVLLGVGDGTLTRLSDIPGGHWCQGATFAADSRTILLQYAYEHQIAVFHVRDGKLVADPAAAISVGARPGAIATALTR